MGLGYRFFIIEKDHSLRRVPFVRYNRLLKREPEETFAKYAGKRIRYALVVLELSNRKPVKIVESQYAVLTLDENGRIDAEEFDQELRLGIQMVTPLDSNRNHSNVIDAKHRFAMKRFQNRYLWKPTRGIKAAIAKAIFSDGLMVE